MDVGELEHRLQEVITERNYWQSALQDVGGRYTRYKLEVELLRTQLSNVTPVYPYTDADVVVIGPQCFASNDRQVINWQGANYVRHDDLDIPSGSTKIGWQDTEVKPFIPEEWSLHVAAMALNMSVAEAQDYVDGGRLDPTSLESVWKLMKEIEGET